MSEIVYASHVIFKASIQEFRYGTFVFIADELNFQFGFETKLGQSARNETISWYKINEFHQLNNKSIPVQLRACMMCLF